MRMHIALSSLLGLALLPMPADAQRLYKWVDENGNVTYSDQVPPSESDLAREELNKQGLAVKRVERAMTAEERAERDAQLAAQAVTDRQNEEQSRRDHVLLGSYPSEADLERAYKERFDLVTQAIEGARMSLASQEKSLSELLAHAAQLEQSGKAVPPIQQASIETARRQTEEQRSFLKRREDEQTSLHSEFNDVLQRYRALVEKATAAKQNP